MHDWLKRYGFIALGIALTACSALISHILVSQNAQDIAEHEQHIAIVESQIEQLWQRNISLKDSEDMLSLLSVASEGASPALRTAVLRQLERAQLHGGISDDESIRMQRVIVPSSQEEALLDAYVITDARKQALVNEIDALYYDKLTSQEAILALKQHNNMLMSWALFLQILGMIFVLIRRGHVTEA